MPSLKVPKMIELYCRLARKEMLPYMGPNSCIAGTRLTVETLRLLGYEAGPIPVKMAFHVPRLQVVFCSGVSAEELATARDKRKVFESGWNGHLVARVNRYWLLDSALDQVASAIPGLDFGAPEVALFPLAKHTGRNFHATYGAHCGSEEVRIEYITTQDRTYEQTEAWLDNGLPSFARQLADYIKETSHALSRTGSLRP